MNMNCNNLRVYQFSDKARQELYDELINIPYHWTIPEIDQALRSSSSVVANIVEGYGRKIYQKEFFKYLSIAVGSSDETQTHIRTLALKGSIEHEKAKVLIKYYKNISILMVNLMKTIKENGFK